MEDITVDYKKKEAVVTAAEGKHVDTQKLIEALEKAGYKGSKVVADEPKGEPKKDEGKH